MFIGKAMCIECHRGPLLSDLKFHNTGVAQFGAHVPQVDGGLGVEVQKGKPEQHLGKWLTPPLRHVEETAPYMHAGQYATLAQVIEFYRRGGDPDGFSGVKDPRMQPLEIDDDEARDLEAFLRTLTGELIPSELTGPL
jgi:cytochrome c peroxidase